MGKQNGQKRKHSLGSAQGASPRVSLSNSPKELDAVQNPLLKRQNKFMNQAGLTDEERYEFFSPSIAGDRRAQLWMDQADLGEDLVNQYAWATPDSSAIRIIKEFSPLVEIGCGANAYWCRVLRAAGVDIIGYDINISTGGIIEGGSKRAKKVKGDLSPWFLKKGGPETLSSKDFLKTGRTLILCYPDEHDDELHQSQADSLDADSDGGFPISMGWQCLHNYSGEYVIHIGETFLDSSFSMDQAPWGRSSAPEFQQRLSSEFHCILKVELPNWFHTRDTLSVWKRSSLCSIVFAADDDDEGKDDEVEYRHIPRSERLPINIAAPCMAHLLPVASHEPAHRSLLLRAKDNGKQYSKNHGKAEDEADGSKHMVEVGSKGRRPEDHVRADTPMKKQRKKRKKSDGN